MGFLSKIFGKKEKIENYSNFPEYMQVLDFNKEFSELLSKDKFLARSDYAFLLSKYKETFEFFASAQKANTLSYYCKTNKLLESEITVFLESFSDIKDLKIESKKIEAHNEKFIRDHLVSEKEYLDNILKEVDPQIILDEEQRRVILSDEDYSLVVAGAGAGKTTTMAAKVRYLIEKKGINPKQILVISFTNKAVGELREKINSNLKIECPITTFHSSGYAILRKKEDLQKKIVTEGFLYDTINKYLKSNVLNQQVLVDKLINFFGTYFDSPYEGDDINQFFNYISKGDFSTLRSNISEYNEQIIDRKTNKRISINNEELRSFQEVQIANYLYLNQIDYSYEEIYPYYILKAKKPYTPDFCIKQGDRVAYIEHFGISESGHSNFYTPAQLEIYKKEIKDKVKLHKDHHTDLIYTFSSYNDGRDLLTHLNELLIKHGFILNKRSSKEVFEKLVSQEEDRYISKLVKLICVFINNFKTNGYTIENFYKFETRNPNIRTKLFLDICKECYLEYQKVLEQNNYIDFQDIINESANMLKEKQIKGEMLDFKYIIVDEYQDISRQRFNLTKELSKICNAKIMAVGDDWQSIYAFSGSDITLFTQFCSIMGYGKELKITKTYRNAQEVIDIAGNFIQKNETQIKKSLISPKSIQKPVIIDTYSEHFNKEEFSGMGGKFYHLGQTVQKVIGKILEQNEKEGKSRNSSILLIGRYGFDARNLCFSNDFVYDEKENVIFCKKYRKAKLQFLTAHSSKGLGFDNVIIVNARNDLYGFPSKIEDDPVLKFVTVEDSSIEYAEERRLFYVAMTRTKNRVYIVTPTERPSEFILELLKDYPNITLNGDLNKEPPKRNIKRCPICGYPLQFRWKKNYGMKLWMCTNEPEICNFISNDLSGKELSIQKCDNCRDGYLIVKKGKEEYFLGCTNYKEDKSGCNRTISPEYYKKWITTNFEEDNSIDLPSYAKLPTVQQEPTKIPIPKTGNVTKNEPTQRKTARVHTTQKRLSRIEKEGFMVVVDDDSRLLTDMELLKKLRSLRAEIAVKEKIAAYLIITNDGLVSLATFKPETKEEFIKLYGLGEKTHEKYGDIFISAIKKFYQV